MKIFDCLTHPTLDQSWLGQSTSNSFEALAMEMKTAGISWACAVGIEGVGQFEAKAFANACSRFPFLFPIAGFNPLQHRGPNLQDTLVDLKQMGYHGIKIHPRFSQIDLQRDFQVLAEACQAAARAELPVFLCTYFACGAHEFPTFDPLSLLAQLVKACDQTSFVLIHGGTVRLLEYIEFARFNPRVLLDLSLTLMKYQGSSLDLDLKFAFQKFDRRICVGSDHPEWPLLSFRKRVEDLCQGLDQDRIDRITHGNLASFLGLSLD